MVDHGVSLQLTELLVEEQLTVAAMHALHACMCRLSARRMVPWC